MLSGSIARRTSSTFLITHNETYSMNIANNNSYETQIGNFWKLDLLEIKENEPYIYEKVLTYIELRDNRYSGKLLFKDNVRTCVSDNYHNSFKCLNKLKRKLNQDTETFIAHQAVIREDHTSTKLRVVFDASFQGT